MIACETKIFFGNEIEKSINDFITLSKHLSNISKKENIEFEIRIGKPYGNHLGMNNEEFKRIKDILLNSSNFKHEHQVRYIVQYNNDIRVKIREIRIGNKSVFQKKEHVDDLKVSMSGFQFKLSISKETELPDVEKYGKQGVIRSVRDSFQTDDLSIDLSTDIIGKDLVNRFEVEFTKVKDLNMSKVSNVLKYILNDLLVGYRFMYFVENNYPDEVKIMKDKMNNLFSYKIKKFQPVDFDKSIHSICDEYTTTKKLNGEYMTIYTSRNFIFFCSKMGTIVDMLYQKGIYTDCFMEAEFFQGKYHVFDCLYYNEDITNLPHRERMNKVELITSKLKDFCFPTGIMPASQFILKKDFYNIDSMVVLYNDLRKQNEVHKGSELYDGIILTNIGAYNLTYKVKFPELLSIDFQAVAFDGKKYSLFSADQNGLIEFSYQNNKYYLEEFPNIELDGKIIECFFQNGKFVFYRIRPDRPRPNYLNTATNIFKLMKYPQDIEEIQKIFSQKVCAVQQPKRLRQSDFVNIMKQECIEYISKQLKSFSILDIGFGRGGTIPKYYLFRKQIEKIYGVEPNEEFIKAYKQTQYRDPQTHKPIEKEFYDKVEIINEYGQNTDKIYKGIVNYNNLVCASFLSLTFFFENEDVLNALVNTISKCDYFTGVAIDGKMLNDLFGNKDEVKIGSIQMKKKYDKYEDNKLGQKILINFENENAIVKDQEEYLVMFEILKQKLEKMGYKLLDKTFFTSTQEKFSELEYTKCHFKFTFKKEKEEKVVEEKKEKTETQKYIDSLKREIVHTIPDGSCFFHSVLTSISYEYSEKNDAEKREYVLLLRQNLSDLFTMEDYEKLYDFLRIIYGDDKEMGFNKLKKNIKNIKSWVSFDIISNKDTQCFQYICEKMRVNVIFIERKDFRKISYLFNDEYPYIFIQVSGNHFNAYKINDKSLFNKDDEEIITCKKYLL